MSYSSCFLYFRSPVHSILSYNSLQAQTFCLFPTFPGVTSIPSIHLRSLMRDLCAGLFHTLFVLLRGLIFEPSSTNLCIHLHPPYNTNVQELLSRYETDCIGGGEGVLVTDTPINPLTNLIRGPAPRTLAFILIPISRGPVASRSIQAARTTVLATDSNLLTKYPRGAGPHNPNPFGPSTRNVTT